MYHFALFGIFRLLVSTYLSIDEA